MEDKFHSPDCSGNPTASDGKSKARGIATESRFSASNIWFESLRV